MDYLLLLILLKESITLTNIRFFIIFSSLFILLLKPVFATTATSNTGSTVTEQSENAVTSSKTSPKRDDASFEKENPNQQYIYEVEYKGISIGEMKQEYRWKGKNVAVNSVADFSFLLFSFGGSQQSDVYWNELQLNQKDKIQTLTHIIYLQFSCSIQILKLSSSHPYH